jgi:hypothetical protein
MTQKRITLTAADFELRYDDEHTFPFFSDEEGTYGFGHIDPTEFAKLVNDYDVLCCAGDPEWRYDESDVKHLYARAFSQDDAESEYGWLFTWDNVTAETEGAFPLTLINR